MGIYIKGMEMPKSCVDCKGAVTINDGVLCTPMFRIVKEILSGRQQDCPLIEVPKHGRLIDADAVYKRLQKQAMSAWGDGNLRYQIILDVMDAIRFAPTIIPAEPPEENP